MFSSRLSQPKLQILTKFILKHTSFPYLFQRPLCYYSLGRFQPLPTPARDSSSKEKACTIANIIREGSSTLPSVSLRSTRGQPRGKQPHEGSSKSTLSPRSTSLSSTPGRQRNACPTESFIPRNCKSNPRPAPFPHLHKNN